MQVKNVFQWKTVSGEPVLVNDMTITPQSQALVFRLPRGAFVWHRPTALLVEQHGQVKRYRILDATRILQMGLLAAGIGISIIGRRVFAQRKEHHS
ncbi:MAG TPA: hypothetical protein VFQ30_03545 [Ktedonobacteraceae bacterium]|nr:hypothetical protein [Ktedonobacteraceae bacterium]